MLELLLQPPVNPGFVVPGLRFRVGSAYDVAPVACISYWIASAGRIEDWYLYQHRNGARYLFRTSLGRPPGGLAEPQNHPAILPPAADLVRLGLPPPPLTGAQEKVLLSAWKASAPHLFNDQASGIRYRWMQSCVTSVAIEFERYAGMEPDPDLLDYVGTVLSARDQANELAGRLHWLEAPRAHLCAWVLQEASAHLQDGVVEALLLDVAELVGFVSDTTLQMLSVMLPKVWTGDLLRLSPADVIAHSLEAPREQLTQGISAPGAGLHWLHRELV